MLSRSPADYSGKQPCRFLLGLFQDPGQYGIPEQYHNDLKRIQATFFPSMTYFTHLVSFFCACKLTVSLQYGNSGYASKQLGRVEVWFLHVFPIVRPCMANHEPQEPPGKKGYVEVCPIPSTSQFQKVQSGSRI